MICPSCYYVFVLPKQPPGLYAREYCPRCRHLLQGRATDWHDCRGWLELYIRHKGDDE